MDASERFAALLTGPDLAAVRETTREIHVKAGGTLYLEGDRSERVILVEEGQVSVTATAPTGEQLLLAIRGPGDIVGEQAAIDGDGHGQTVRAMTDVRARSMTGGDFLSLLEDRPSLSLALHQVQVRRLREADQMRLEQLAFDVTGRIARRLADFHETAGALDLRISHRELATWVGASREAVTKSLAKLERRGLVSTTRGRIVVTDLDELRGLAGR
jgi:CRP-like cAMP-binding protein